MLINFEKQESCASVLLSVKGGLVSCSSHGELWRKGYTLRGMRLRIVREALTVLREW